MNHPATSGSTRRHIVGVALPLLAVAVAGAMLFRTGSLPDPMASHWDVSGDPDDSIAKAMFYGLFTSLVVLTGSASLWASRRRDIRRGDLAPPVALTTFMQWTFVGVTVVATIANDGAPAWQQADGVSLPVALLIPLIAAAIATAAGSIVRPLGSSDDRTAELPSVRRGSGERLAWLNHVNVRWPLILAGGLALIGTELVLWTSPAIGIVVLLAAATVAMLAWIQVSADHRGLIVRYGPIRWPRTHIELDRIEQAAVIDVSPGRHGGWGYRGSITVLGRAALVVRSGEGLQLDLRNGKRFIVTVDDAATAAGTLNDLIDA